MNKKHFLKLTLSLILSLTLFSVLLTGCGKDEEETTGQNAQATETPAPKPEPTPEPEPEVTDYSLADIANLNGCSEDELNVLFYNDYMVFLGEKYTDMKVLNEQDAMESLKYISTLAGLDGVGFDFYRLDESPVSGYNYFTFLQTLNVEVDGNITPVKYYYNLIKVIADKEGNVKGMSADICHDEMPEYSEEDILPAKDVESYILDLAQEYSEDPEVGIYPEHTSFLYWDDAGTSGNLTDGNVIPVWAVYTDSIFDEASCMKNPYTAWLVYALDDLPSRDGSITYEVINVYEAASLEFFEEMDDVYTSELFFKDLEDAGEYHYDIDMSWAKGVTGYQGPAKFSVDVPVAYSPDENLYYLCDVNNKIAVGNTYDWRAYYTTNCVVTEDPTDLKGWHWQIDKSPDTDQKYFFDPGYVLSTYFAFTDTLHGYQDRYGFKTVDFSGLPVFLGMYMSDPDDGYPGSISDFEDNAYNSGQENDWNVFVTSPNTTCSIDYNTLAHEFAHGINGKLTCSQYLNGMGAVMEGYADILGGLLCAVNGKEREEYYWMAGNEIYEPIRSYEDPYMFNNPKYLFGSYYVKPVSWMFCRRCDNGGVHINSGCVNHLAYQFCNADTDNPDSLLTMEEDLDMWMESLYSTTHDTSYYELGHYLIFSSEAMGLDPAKQDTVYNITYQLGFLEDTTYLEELIADEDPSYFAITLDDQTNDTLSFMYRIYDFATNSYYYLGEPNSEGNMVYFVENDKDIADPALEVFVGDYYNDIYLGHLDIPDLVEGIDNTITVEEFDIPLGSNFDFGEETILTFFFYDAEGNLVSNDYGEPFYDLRGKSKFEPPEPGNYFISTCCGEGEYSVTILNVTEE